MWRTAVASGLARRSRLVGAAPAGLGTAFAATVMGAAATPVDIVAASRLQSSDHGRGRGRGGRGRGRGQDRPMEAQNVSRAASPRAAADAIVAMLKENAAATMPLGAVIATASPEVRNSIIASGKGLEGFIRQFGDFAIRVEGTDRLVSLAGDAAEQHREELAARAAAVEKIRAPSAFVSAEEIATAEAPTASAASANGADMAGEHQTTSPVAEPVAIAEPPSENPAEATTDGDAQPAGDSTPSEPAAGAADVTRVQNEVAAAPETEPASEPTPEPTPPAAKPTADAAASVPAETGKPPTPAGAATSDAEGLAESIAADPDDPNFETRKRVLNLMPLADTWYLANDVYNALYRGSTDVPYSDFVLYLRGSPDFYWFHRGTVARRLPRHTVQPPKVPHLVVSIENIRRGFVLQSGHPNPEAPSPDAPAAATSPAANVKTSGLSSALPPEQPKVTSGPSDRPAAGAGLHEVPSAVNNYGGWGAAANVPTSADVFEILKFIPIHWMNFGELNIPKEIKKRHVRVSKPLSWFARQPRYFDLRIASGTIEVRRSVLLHPEAHNMTKAEAEEAIQKRIEADKAAGEPIPLIQARAPTSAAPKVKGEPIIGGSAVGSSGSASVDATTKILLRVCPGYYISTDTIIRRATKKLELLDIVTSADHNKNHLDQLTVQSATNTKVHKTFLRRKTGIEASKWEAQFTEELRNSPDLESLVECMSRGCAQWDRLHFLYVRLPDETKAALNGFEGMTEFLRAHPHVFLVGEYFYKRIDPSDPHFDATEPDSNAITSTKQLEDNPYHLSKELATVFNYLAPEDQPCSLSHFVECCSPAMKSVLPPRLITVVQSHPELLSYREVSPGTYAVSRASETAEGQELLSGADTVDEIVKLVPPRGIDASHLMNSLTPSLRANVVRHFGQEAIHELVARNMHLFHVVRNPPYVTLFLKKPRRTQD